MASMLAERCISRLAADSVHPVQGTVGGCLLYITSSVHDELLGVA